MHSLAAAAEPHFAALVDDFYAAIQHNPAPWRLSPEEPRKSNA